MDNPQFFSQAIATRLGLQSSQVGSTLDLLESGNTIPFIARYRKEATNGLDEEQLREIEALYGTLKTLEERREAILNSIAEQGKLTEALKAQVLAAETRTALEDLYQPYRPRRRTRATIARERGLEPLAALILAQARPQEELAVIATPYLSAEVPTMEDAWQGARDIVAETVSDHPEVRRITREKALQWGTLSVTRREEAEDTRAVYQDYYEWQQRVDRVRPHQILAINRGEQEDVLRVQVDVQERDWRAAITTHFRPDRRSPLAPHLEQAAEDAAKRLLLPAIERDVRRVLTEEAERYAIEVFARNLRALLLQPPLSGHIVLGIDPGFRTGCKVAVVDATGKVLETATIYPHAPRKQWQASLDTLSHLAGRHGVTLIAIGNGTASRETEQLVAELTREREGVRYLIVNEAGASIYSASPLARAELPDLDVTLRGAVSIARRVQDPLAELVKIDPKSIGVGLYQHDVNQGELSDAVDGVVESVVNHVGVDVNSASPALLEHVAGIGPRLAERIVAHRDREGPFATRRALLEVSGLGPKSFEQAAGFLRIRGGPQPLDASAIHPESYQVAEQVLRRAGLSASTPLAERQGALERLQAEIPLPRLAEELGTGVPTLADILEQLVRPGRDPREDFPAPILRSDVLSMEDLLTGMRLQGAVRNVVPFGAFVDIGVKQDGLLHRSQFPRGVSLTVGDVIEAEILKVEAERGRISLGWVAGSARGRDRP